MQTHPHLDRPRAERLLTLRRRGKRVVRIGEGVQEGVSLCIDLNAAVGGEGASQETAVLAERFDITLFAEIP